MQVLIKQLNKLDTLDSSVYQALPGMIYQGLIKDSTIKRFKLQSYQDCLSVIGSPLITTSSTPVDMATIVEFKNLKSVMVEVIKDLMSGECMVLGVEDVQNVLIRVLPFCLMNMVDHGVPLERIVQLFVKQQWVNQSTFVGFVLMNVERILPAVLQICSGLQHIPYVNGLLLSLVDYDTDLVDYIKVQYTMPVFQLELIKHDLLKGQLDFDYVQSILYYKLQAMKDNQDLIAYSLKQLALAFCAAIVKSEATQLLYDCCFQSLIACKACLIFDQELAQVGALILQSSSGYSDEKLIYLLMQQPQVKTLSYGEGYLSCICKLAQQYGKPACYALNEYLQSLLQVSQLPLDLQLPNQELFFDVTKLVDEVLTQKGPYNKNDLFVLYMLVKFDKQNIKEQAVERIFHNLCSEEHPTRFFDLLVDIIKLCDGFQVSTSMLVAGLEKQCVVTHTLISYHIMLNDKSAQNKRYGWECLQFIKPSVLAMFHSISCLGIVQEVAQLTALYFSQFTLANTVNVEMKPKYLLDVLCSPVAQVAQVWLEHAEGQNLNFYLQTWQLLTRQNLTLVQLMQNFDKVVPELPGLFTHAVYSKIVLELLVKLIDAFYLYQQWESSHRNRSAYDVVTSRLLTSVIYSVIQLMPESRSLEVRQFLYRTLWKYPLLKNFERLDLTIDQLKLVAYSMPRDHLSKSVTKSLSASLTGILILALAHQYVGVPMGKELDLVVKQALGSQLPDSQKDLVQSVLHILAKYPQPFDE